MTREKSVPTISQEELSNRRCQFARILFLEQLSATCPHVRDDLLNIWSQLEKRIREAILALQEQVDDKFDAVREEFLAERDRSGMGNISISGPTVNVWSWYRSAPQGPNTLRSELEGAIRGWAQTYKIEAEWVIDAAIENICRWHQNPALEDEQRWLPPSVGMLGILSPEEAEFQFRLPHAWEPTIEKPTVARKRITEAFKAQLDSWLDEVELLAKNRGLPEIPDKRKLVKHLRWLVQFQILRHSFTDIARNAGLEVAEAQGRKTVAAAVRSTAELIGLHPLRDRDLGGRPPTSR